MNITPETLIKEVLGKYPDLLDKLVVFFPKLKFLNTPLGKALIGKSSVADVSKKAGLDAGSLIAKITEFIK